MFERLVPARTLLLVVDVQERLASAMPDARMTRLVANAEILLEAARLCRIPTLATEQYPKGLGPTLAPLASKLTALGVTPTAKMTFDALGAPDVAMAFAMVDPSAVIVLGMESHVCVFQTARDVIIAGKQVFVPQDAVLSRHAEMCGAGLHLIEQAGGVITTTETILFDLIKKAGTPAFKTVLSWIKPASVSPIGFGR